MENLGYSDCSLPICKTQQISSGERLCCNPLFIHRGLPLLANSLGIIESKHGNFNAVARRSARRRLCLYVVAHHVAPPYLRVVIAVLKPNFCLKLQKYSYHTTFVTWLTTWRHCSSSTETGTRPTYLSSLASAWRADPRVAIL